MAKSLIRKPLVSVGDTVERFQTGPEGKDIVYETGKIVKVIRSGLGLITMEFPSGSTTIELSRNGTIPYRTYRIALKG